ncbi:MAG: DNA-protecting protein DprA [Sphingobacteriales bacterium]|nr:MAG: DNA-protecting protein DprA [Sphingobacteriales bacterium]
MLPDNLIYQIALTLIPKVGSYTAKTLISYCGGVNEIFKMPKSKLLKIPNIGEKIASSITDFKEALKKAEKEIEFIQKHGIRPMFYLDKDYPYRLKSIQDAPIMLYYKGNANLNQDRIISIVGTRKATDYGKKICNRLIEELAGHQVVVVSGLAYGIDHAAHQACLQHQVPTLGVLAHGLDRIYPPAHQKLASAMLENGGLITEYISKTKPDKVNFPNRNRIIAGISDATVVVETRQTGGSMITAQIANSYNRSVFAFPGRTTDLFSSGCNYLVKKNLANLVEYAKDITDNMMWPDSSQKAESTQKQMFVELEPDEELIVNTLKKADNNELHLENLWAQTQLSPGMTAAALISLEFKGLVRPYPGKIYRLC